MVWRVWALVAAVLCGVGVASASGAVVTRWSYVIAVAAVAAGAVATAVVVASRSAPVARRRNWATYEPEPVLSPVAAPEVRRDDADVVAEIIGPRTDRAADWLRTQRFSSPWQATEAEALRALTGLDRSSIVENGLASAVEALVGSVRSFFDLYDRCTIADPIVAGGAWHMVDPERTGRGDADPEQALREAGRAVVAAYDGVRAILPANS